MKIIFSLVLFIASCISVGEPPAPTETLEDSVFMLGPVKIGVTSFDQIRYWFGAAETTSAEPDGSHQQICYVLSSNGRTRHVIFETGPMGGFKKVTGIRIGSKVTPKSCRALNTGSELMAFRNGVQLGQEKTEFIRRFNVKFQQESFVLTYESDFRREATLDELSLLRKNWPMETRTYFNVNVYVRAQFSEGQLEDYYVRRIESYN
jgi:hypothetical protein